MGISADRFLGQTEARLSGFAGHERALKERGWIEPKAGHLGGREASKARPVGRD